jgi:hypothetical protein
MKKSPDTRALSPRQAERPGHPPGGSNSYSYSALGPPQKNQKVLPRSTLPKSYKLAMSALPPKADISAA